MDPLAVTLETPQDLENFLPLHGHVLVEPIREADRVGLIIPNREIINLFAGLDHTKQTAIQSNFVEAKRAKVVRLSPEFQRPDFWLQEGDIINYHRGVEPLSLRHGDKEYFLFHHQFILAAE